MAALMHQTPSLEPNRFTTSAEPVARFFALTVVPAPEPMASPAPARPPLRVIPGGREAALRRRLPAHVYRRRRLVVLVAMLVFSVAATVALGAGQFEDAASTSGTPQAPSVTPAAVASDASLPDVYVVQPGDSLWSIATELSPTTDPRPLVDQIAGRNGGASLEAGARLDLRGLGGR